MSISRRPATPRGSLVNAGDARCIEIWNLVFIQFNANPDGTFVAAPRAARRYRHGLRARHRDHPGHEELHRLQRQDLELRDRHLSPDLRRDRKAERQDLRLAPCPRSGSTGETEQEKIDVAFRVIADHIRTLSFAIADGIQPSNEGRNYVLRRILRRAVRYGRTLGFHEPFFFKLVDVVARTMGEVFPELRAKQTQISETIRREEESFNKTLDRGLELFARETEQAQSISGAFAFRLYDEQGFPLDLTELMARERGLSVDTEGFEKLMEEQRERARAAQKKSVITIADVEAQNATHFLGYDHDHTGADVEKVVDLKDKTGVILNNSVLYAEMGGQVGDHGEIDQ